MRKIRLAIVDDSLFIRKAIERVLEGDDDITIVGLAATGEELINNLNHWKPDVITLDLSMPGMGGIPTLDIIMARQKIPVIILSTHSSKDAPMTIEALHRGAVDFIDKQQYSLVDFDALRNVLREKILHVTGKGVISNEKQILKTTSRPVLSGHILKKPLSEFKIIAIGASTGGPPAIQKILENLNPVPKVPIVIVQHMPTGFTKPFAERLNSHLHFPVREAYHGEILEAGTAYIAPCDFHLKVRKENNHIYHSLSQYPEVSPHRPSVDILFQSVAEVFGRYSLGILLTGMGQDGAIGLKCLFLADAWTITQSKSSCVVYGMPKAADDLGVARENIHINQIGSRIMSLFNIPTPDNKKH
ncbi:chemotaxis-specific protein-glutamate methyltransferase CheB [bacterium]|nr:chemotaxis-specific protein-glutamate methyltransferase CheB [bacterium]